MLSTGVGATLALVLFLVVAPLPVAAHSRLLRSEPLAGQVLVIPPATVQLWFSEPVAVDFSTIQVLDRGRKHHEAGAVANVGGDKASLGIALAPDLPSGSYFVAWHVVSATDGHLTEGNYPFTVRRAGEAVPTPGPELTPEPGTTSPDQPSSGSTPSPSLLRWGLRALALILAAWLLGGPLFSVLILEPGLPGGEPANLVQAAQRRWSRISLVAVLGLLLLLGADMLFQVADLAGTTPLGALGQGSVLVRFVSTTSYGGYWLLRVGAAAVIGMLLLVLGRVRQASVTLWSGTVAAGGLVFAGEALSSHQAAAATVFGLPLGTLADLLHLMATGAWVGGLLYVAVILLPLLHVPGVPARARGQVLAHLIPRFSNLALISVGILIVTGLINLALHTLDPQAIVASNYGQVLIAKHLLFLPLLLLGLVQNRQITPRLARILGDEQETGSSTVQRFGRLIRGEALLMAAVLFCAAGLTLLPPPVAGQGATPPAVITPTPAPTRPAIPPTPSPTPVVVTGTQTLGGLIVGLVVAPDPAGDRFTVRLQAEDGSPLVPTDLRLQLKITPQDVNAGSTLAPLGAATADGPALVYTATDFLLPIAGGYDTRVIITRRQGNDVKVAYRLDLGDDGTLAIRSAPYVQAQVSTLPSPPISGTVQIDLRLSDGLGAPVEGATVQLIPVMPAHGHIEPQEIAQPVPGTPGLYRATSTMQMGGGWLLVIDVNQPGQPPIRTDASFDVIDPNATATPAGEPSGTAQPAPSAVIDPNATPGLPAEPSAPATPVPSP